MDQANSRALQLRSAFGKSRSLRFAPESTASRMAYLEQRQSVSAAHWRPASTRRDEGKGEEARLPEARRARRGRRRPPESLKSISRASKTAELSGGKARFTILTQPLRLLNSRREADIPGQERTDE